jgi:hypothetical protein
VTDHGHSTKTVYLPIVSPFFLTLSLSLTLSPRRCPVAVRAPRRPIAPLAVRSRHRRAPPSTRPARPPSLRRRPPPRPRPSTRPSPHPRPPAHRLPHPCPPPRPRPPSVAPSTPPRLVVSPTTPRPVVSPATRRLDRDQTSKVIYMKRLGLILSHIYIRVLVRLICSLVVLSLIEIYIYIYDCRPSCR